ncbi:Imidazoleglycerol-phosphate dehydratase [bioreactor metagenome]|uniref:Imidazoleglycerol-phosphate dehydratase n=1 Tax=bioreactor metagenome TaxID=1076179 RepID=A0A645I826_9ZZZZ
MHRNVSFKTFYDLRHHLWEDSGITTGMYLKELIKDKNYARFGTSVAPMDDALILCCIDISRTYYELDLKIRDEEEGFELSLLHEFVGGLCRSLSATIHLKQLAAGKTRKSHGQNPDVNQHGGKSAERFRHIRVSAACRCAGKDEGGQKKRRACAERKADGVRQGKLKAFQHIRHGKHHGVNRRRGQELPVFSVKL